MKDNEGNEMEGSELLTKWLEVKKVYRFEGESGVRDLEQLFTAMGYADRYQDPIRYFLSDNPGVCEAIVTWVEEQLDRGSPEWIKGLTDEIEEATQKGRFCDRDDNEDDATYDEEKSSADIAYEENA